MKVAAVRSPNRARTPKWANVASMLRLLGLSAALAFGGMGSMGSAQTQHPLGNDSSSPSIPANASLLQASGQATDAGPSSASISGVVLDPSGAVVRGATVKLAGTNAATERAVVADDQGGFLFSGLPAGTFKVTVASATGLTTFTSDPVTLAEGQKLELPPITLRITVASSDVHVVGTAATQEEVAQAQIQAQEKQRVLGIVPNFYSSYIWNAAPMTSKQKFGLALRSTTDPVAFMVAGGVAGVEQWHHTFPGYGRGTDGYLKRYGAAYADNMVGRMVGSAILPSLLHQDPRYFYKGSGSATSRALYAISQTVICRGDNGRSEPNYSHVLGNFAAAGISNLYRAPQDRSASLTFRNALIITGSNAIGNLVREFVLRKITPKVPDYAQGEP
ncbi:MAG: carboxypeptidase-like regulatory domain-containing protein [Acidobacteriaceae bacterium]